MATTRRFPGENESMTTVPGQLAISFIDARRAHFVSDAAHAVYVELPPDLQQEGENKVGLLQKSMYGTRDAGAYSEKAKGKIMGSPGFKQNPACPSTFLPPFT